MGLFKKAVPDDISFDTSLLDKDYSYWNRGYFPKDVLSLYDDAIDLYLKAYSIFKEHYTENAHFPVYDESAYIISMGADIVVLFKLLRPHDDFFAFGDSLVGTRQTPLMRISTLYDLVHSTCSLLTETDYSLLAFRNALFVVMSKLSEFEDEMEFCLKLGCYANCDDDADIEDDEADIKCEEFSDEELHETAHKCKCGGKCSCGKDGNE